MENLELRGPGSDKSYVYQYMPRPGPVFAEDSSLFRSIDTNEFST